LSIRLQPFSETAAVPFTVAAPLAELSRASTQPSPPLATATERAEMLRGAEVNSDENSRACGCLMITSTAPAVDVWLPDTGG
jgi:hypothetical protein